MYSFLKDFLVLMKLFSLSQFYAPIFGKMFVVKVFFYSMSGLISTLCSV